jgi:hypothetical protein
MRQQNMTNQTHHIENLSSFDSVQRTDHILTSGYCLPTTPKKRNKPNQRRPSVSLGSEITKQSQFDSLLWSLVSGLKMQNKAKFQFLGSWVLGFLVIYAKRTQFSAFSIQKQGLPKKRTHFEPISNPNQTQRWAKRPCFVIIYPGPQGPPHSGSCLPTSGSFKKQNEPKLEFLGSWVLGHLCKTNPILTYS